MFDNLIKMVLNIYQQAGYVKFIRMDFSMDKGELIDVVSYFYQNIIFLRKKHNLSQREMAEIIGISVGTLRRLERGTKMCGPILRWFSGFASGLVLRQMNYWSQGCGRNRYFVGACIPRPLTTDGRPYEYLFTIHSSLFTKNITPCFTGNMG